MAGVTDVMCCIFLIIPHSVEAAGRRLGGSSASSSACLFSAGSSDNSPGLCFSESHSRADRSSADGGSVGSCLVLE